MYHTLTEAEMVRIRQSELLQCQQHTRTNCGGLHGSAFPNSMPIFPGSRSEGFKLVADRLKSRAAELREKAAAANIFDGDRVKYLYAAREIERLAEEINS